MGVRYRQVWAFRQGSVSIDKVLGAGRAVGFKVKRHDGRGAVLGSRVNWKSWGERIAVHLSDVNDETLVDVSSTCVLPTQIVDLGRNEANVSKLLEAIDREADLGKARTVPLCSVCGYPAIETEALRCSECGGAITSDAAHGFESGTSLLVTSAFAVVAFVLWYSLMLVIGTQIDVFPVVLVGAMFFVVMPGFHVWTRWQRRKRRASM